MGSIQLHLMEPVYLRSWMLGQLSAKLGSDEKVQCSKFFFNQLCPLLLLLWSARYILLTCWNRMLIYILLYLIYFILFFFHAIFSSAFIWWFLTSTPMLPSQSLPFSRSCIHKEKKIYNHVTWHWDLKKKEMFFQFLNLV